MKGTQIGNYDKYTIPFAWIAERLKLRETKGEVGFR
jgi:hypothetical protein